MPLYDYICASCAHRFEVIHGVHAEGPSTCPECGGGPVRKGMTAPTIHFKGTGWAKKDRRPGPGPSSTTTEPSSPDSKVTSTGGSGGSKDAGSGDAAKGSSSDTKKTSDQSSTGNGSGGSNAAADGAKPSSSAPSG
jgi:putative FmdB family regulatory protein